MTRHFERAIVLYRQGRYDLAETELRGALAHDPGNPVGHAVLSLCLNNVERYQEATEEARQAIHLAPDLPLGHYALACVLSDRERLEEARAAVNEAIRLEPDDADNFGLLAGIELKSRDWQAALDAARMGLQSDPEHSQCTNIRAMALVNLGRKAEAGAAIDAALRRDPENAATHANMGWTLLHHNEPRQAMEHFREALRIEPEMEWARLGIVEAMKARNLIYRWLLTYFLWMSRLSHKAQWGVIIGAYFAFKILRTLARQRPDLAPYLYPVLALYLVFVLLTWIGEPLFNMLLRLNRFGRLALSRDEVNSANWLAVCLGGAIVGVAAYFATGYVPMLIAGIGAGLLTIPVAATGRRPSGWPRKLLTLYTLALVGLSAGAVVSACLAPQPFSPGAETPLFNTFAALFFVGWAVFQWVANAVSMARVKH